MDKHRILDRGTGSDFTPHAESPDLPPAVQGGEQLRVIVLYTTHTATLAALQIASRLAANLGMRFRVLRLYSVPYTLPLDRPGVPIDFLEEQMTSLAEYSTTGFTARVCLCREPRWTLREIFPPRSVIFMGGKRRWWITREQRWARVLKGQGHEVMFVDCE